MDFSDKIQRFTSYSPDETLALAEKLASRLTGGEVIAFTGGMGMGKTTFTRGLAIGLGAGDVASSPTFVLLNEYRGRLYLEHFDMYRIETWEDLQSTGFFDYLDTDRVLVIEWSENIEGALPDKVIRVKMEAGPAENQRSITISGWKEGL